MTVPTNPNVEFTVEGYIGAGFNRRTNATTETQPLEHKLGTTKIDSTGKVWVYVHAPAAIGSNANVTITWGTIDAASVGSKTVNLYVNGTAAFAADDYGWVQSVGRLGWRPTTSIV